MKIRFFSLLLLSFFAVCSSAQAQIDTVATSAFIVDAGTGTVLLDKNGNQPMPTSSMSKVMTMYMVFEDLRRGHIGLNDDILISEKAWRMEGSKTFVKVGDKVKVEDLIRGVIVQSGNDASVALAEGVAGTEEAFVTAMNARAKELGMTSSQFANATGWPDPNHFSTPRDLALLAFRIIHDFPEHYHYFSEKEFTYNKIRQHIRNPLIGKMDGADGLKTGHTEVAGYGLIGSAQRDGRRVIMVLNGLTDEKARASESIRLMEWAFRNFETVNLVKAEQVIDVAQVWLGQDIEVPLVAERGLDVVLPRAGRQDIKMTAKYQAPLKAPIKKGDTVGTLRVEIPGQNAVEIPLKTGAAVERKGLFARAKSRLDYLLTGAL
jgi:D-alanyl-D-alanine carboxypeptidase (penicillin-binding protein 5/6)